VTPASLASAVSGREKGCLAQRRRAHREELDRINRMNRILKRYSHRRTQTATDILSLVPLKAGLESQRQVGKAPFSQKPRNAGLPVPKHREMGGTIQRIEKASFCYLLNGIHPITFERGSRFSRSTLDFSVSRATVRERA